MIGCRPGPFVRGVSASAGHTAEPMASQISYECTVAAPLEAVAQALVAECSQTDEAVSRPATDRVEYRNGVRRGAFLLRRVNAASTAVTWIAETPLPRYLHRPAQAVVNAVGQRYFRRIEVTARALADAATVGDAAPSRPGRGTLPPPTPGRTVGGRG